MERTVVYEREKLAGSEFEWDHSLTNTALAAAEHLAQQVGRRRGMSSADREDLRQDILLALVTRANRYSADRGAWSTYVRVLARHALTDRDQLRRSDLPIGDADDLAQDVADPLDLPRHLALRLDLAKTISALPPPLVQVIALIVEHGSVADAQRASNMPLCAFYRQLNEIRTWLRAAGLTPLVRKIRGSVGK